MTTHILQEHNEEKEMRGMIEKVVVNIGVGRLSQQSSFLEKTLPQITRDLAFIAGQAPHLRPAKRSIASFKVREGQPVGVRVTLRGQKMVDFMKRLIMIVLPRVRDFRGVALNSVDAGGVLNIGITEHTVFPEINPEQSPAIFSLGVNVVPKTRNRKEALEFFRRIHFPLREAAEEKRRK